MMEMGVTEMRLLTMGMPNSDLLACFDEFFGFAQNLFLDFVNSPAHILAHAVFERDAHGDRADIQALMPDHLDGA